jgi:hypothetical protein
MAEMMAEQSVDKQLERKAVSKAEEKDGQMAGPKN